METLSRVPLKLPRAHSIETEVWQWRHRWLLRLVWAQLAGIAVIAFATGHSAPHVAADLVPVAVLGLIAGHARAGRTAQSICVALALVGESAVLVHVTGGQVVVHFHFFVMLVALSLYEDAVPFFAAIGFVLVEHGIVGMVAPEAVWRGDEAALREPWRYALIHAMFVAAAAGLQMLAWNANERVRGKLREAELEASRKSEDVRALAEVTRRVASESDARQSVLDAVRSLTGATFAVLVEPGSESELSITTTSGVAISEADRSIPLDGTPSMAAKAYLSRASCFAADTQDNAEVSRRLVKATGAASVLFQPAIASGQVRGVLGLGWAEPIEGVCAREVDLAAHLADEGAIAIERAGHLRELERAARTDVLTGIGNRRAWDDALHVETERAVRTGDPLSVVLLDLDYFKALNDEQGHQAGDRALKACVAAWRAQLRPTDVLARLGGDEFGLLLPACAEEQARGIAGRLASLTPHAPGASFGVACWDGAEPGSAVVSRADAELYEQKAVRRT